MNIDLTFSTLSIVEQTAIQDYVDHKIAAAAAAAQQDATATNALEEAERVRAAAQDKEPRSNDNSSHAQRIAQDITKAFQGIQM